MACKEEKKDIGGKSIFVRQWSATKALEMQAKLISGLGDISLPFIEGNATFGHYLAIMRDYPEFIPVMKEFVCSARVDGKDISNAMFDIEYSGDLMRVYETFAFVVEVQFKDFFAVGLGTLDQK